MIPLIQYVLGIKNDNVVLRFTSKEGQKRQTERVVKSETDFREFMLARMKKYNLKQEDLIIMCSSSMDFPEDDTENKATIALAHALR
jgi:hypothetical protein